MLRTILGLWVMLTVCGGSHVPMAVNSNAIKTVQVVNTWKGYAVQCTINGGGEYMLSYTLDKDAVIAEYNKILRRINQ